MDSISLVVHALIDADWTAYDWHMTKWEPVKQIKKMNLLE